MSKDCRPSVMLSSQLLSLSWYYNLVVPLTSSIKGDVEEHDRDIWKYLTCSQMLIKYVVYLFSYAMVLDFWFVHVSIFSIIEQVDGIMLTLNLLCLLFISFLPFTNILISGYAVNYMTGYSEQLAIDLCAGDIAVIGVIMAVMLLYGFRRQQLLHPEVMKNDEIRTIRIASIIAILVKPFMALLSLLLSFTLHAVGVSPLPSMVVFYSTIIVVVFVRLIFYLYFKKYKKTIDRLPRHLFKTIASKFRIEFFSDGIFAIVATLIVLDITTEAEEHLYDPNEDETLSESLKRRQRVILSYVINFTLVGLLWFIHYQMFHFIKKLTPALTIINFMILFLVGGIPFASKLDAFISSDYTGMGETSTDSQKQVSLQVLSTLVLLISLFEMIFWTVAIYTKKKCMSPEVERYHSEALQFSKIMVLPCTSLLTYYCSYSEVFINSQLEAVFFLSTPIIYLILDITFRVYGRCQQRRKLRRANKKHNDTTAVTIDEPHAPFADTNYQVGPKISHDPYVYRPRSRALRVQIADNSYSSVSPSPGASYASRYETEDELDLVLGREGASEDEYV